MIYQDIVSCNNKVTNWYW